MNTLDLGNIYANLQIDTRDLDRASREAKQFSRSADSAFKSAEASAASFKNNAGKAALAGGVAIKAGLGLAAREALSFGDVFLDVEKNVKGLNDLTVDNFKNEILEVGSNSLIGAEGVAALASEGGKLGESAKGALEFAKTAEQIAVAFDFGKTVDAAKQAGNIIGGIRTQFGLSTEGVLEFSDAINFVGDNMATTAQEIIATIGRQGSTIKNATNLANSEIAALAGTFNALSNGPEVAATAMKNFTLALSSGANATDKQKALFKELGFDAEQLAKSLKTNTKGTIDEVFKALRQVDPSELTGIVESLFGRESIGAVSSLVAQNDLLADSFKLVADSSKFLGSVKGESDRLNESDGAQLTLAMNSLKVTMIKAGDVIVPVIAKLAKSAADFFRDLNDNNPQVFKVVVGLLAAAAALIPVTVGVIALVGAIGPLVIAAGGLGAALGVIAGVAIPVVAALAAIVAGGGLLYQNWDEVSAFWKESVESVKNFFTEWAEDSAAFEMLKEAWTGLKDSAVELFGSLKARVREELAFIIEDFHILIDSLGGFDNVMQLFKSAFGNALDFVTSSLGAFVRFFSSTFDNIKEYLDGNISGWEFWKNQVDNVGVLVGEIIGNMITFIKNQFGALLKFLEGMSIDFKSIGVNLMQGLINGIKSKAGEAVDAVKNTAGSIIDSVKSKFDQRSPSRVFAQIGRFNVIGMAMGIAAATPEAERAAELSAAKTLIAYEQSISAEKSKMQEALNASIGLDAGGSSSGGFGGLGGFADSVPGAENLAGLETNGIPGFPDLEEISTYFDDRIALLAERGLEETEEVKTLERNKVDAVRAGFQMQLGIAETMFGSLAEAARGFAGEQSGIYKGLLAVQRGFAAAEVAVALVRNVAAASQLGFPQNIPLIAGAFAQGAKIASMLSSVPAFNNGTSTLATGRQGIAGEKGVEIVGPAGVLSTQNTKELFGSMGDGGGSSNVFVEIIDNSGSNNTHTVEQTNDGGEERIKVIIDRVEKKLTGDVARGIGNFDRTMRSSYGISRTGS